jgi:hypothetical protein
VVQAGGDVHLLGTFREQRLSSATYDYVSHDGARTWEPGSIYLELSLTLTGIVAGDATTFLRFPNYNWVPRSYSTTISVSRDGGRSWEDIVPVMPEGFHFDAESFADARHGWALISRNLPPCPPGYSCPYAGEFPTTLAATNDGGQTWRVGT